MLEAISQNYLLFDIAASIGMLAIWLAYLQVLIRAYRKTQRAKIVINSGIGRSLDARCLISNMSEKAIYIESIIACLEAEHEQWVGSLTDIEDIDPQRLSDDPKQGTRQGPLLSGTYIDIGSFRTMLDRMLRHQTSPGSDPFGSLGQSAVLEVQIYGDYVSEDDLVGAKRRFVIKPENGDWSVRPIAVQTEQIEGRRERQRIVETLQKHL